MRTIEMDESRKRTDLVVIGGTEGAVGWRAEVLSIDENHVKKTWDSSVSARGKEFGNSGPANIKLLVKDGNYDLIIEGCVPHECSNGIFGFLIYSGKSGRTARAKVITKLLTSKIAGLGQKKYVVIYSSGTDAAERRDLQKLICNSGSNEISSKVGLPFSCDEL